MGSQTLTPRQIADSFKIRCSAIIEIMAEMGLTEKQVAELNELTNRHNGLSGKPLTKLQDEKRIALVEKQKNPELPDGAKTHCKKWLKNFRFGRYQELKAKQVRKGNDTEEDGFTLMATELKLGMVYKNKERRSNEWMTGECDLHLAVKKAVYDNKASWSLDTFPMYETEFDKRYWWQLEGYGCLWEAESLNLCFTLNDDTDIAIENAIKWIEDHNEKYRIAEKMHFTDKNHFEGLKQSLFPDATLDTFIPIPDEDRIVHFEFNRDDKAIESIKDRVLLCREYIYQLLTKKQQPC